VTKIYNYFKKYGHNTIVMGASFRNKGEIIELAGCDRLTIAPSLLTELEAMNNPEDKLLRKLSPDEAQDITIAKVEDLNEARFRWEMNEDAMATEKLAEGIRRFAADLRTLEEFIQTKLN
jgi:transaldolase